MTGLVVTPQSPTKRVLKSLGKCESVSYYYHFELADECTVFIRAKRFIERGQHEPTSSSGRGNTKFVVVLANRVSFTLFGFSPNGTNTTGVRTGDGSHQLVIFHYSRDSVTDDSISKDC